MTLPVGQAFFERLGLPFDDAERDVMHAMLHGAPGAIALDVVGINSWIQVVRLVHTLGADDGWAEWEEEERQRLWLLAAEQHTEHDLHRRLTAMNDALASDVNVAAARAAERDGIADAETVGAAAAAALLAAHQASLVGLAGLPHEHYFRLKFDLFRGGRWPVGVIDGVYRVF